MSKDDQMSEKLQYIPPLGKTERLRVPRLKEPSITKLNKFF